MRAAARARTRARKKTLADQLREAIVASRMTDHRLAREAGVSQSTVGRFMRAERSLTLDTAELVAEVLGLVIAPSPRAGAPRPASNRRDARPKAALEAPPPEPGEAGGPG